MCGVWRKQTKKAKKYEKKAKSGAKHQIVVTISNVSIRRKKNVGSRNQLKNSWRNRYQSNDGVSMSKAKQKQAEIKSEMMKNQSKAKAQRQRRHRRHQAARSRRVK